MTDLIERLREYVAEIADAYWPSPYMKEAVNEAADEIERLREALEQIAMGCDTSNEAQVIAWNALEKEK